MPKKREPLTSSDSEISDNEITGDESSSIVTSFDSRVAAKEYKKGSSKNASKRKSTTLRKSPLRVSQSSNVSPSPKRGRSKISTTDQYDSETDTQRSSAKEHRIASDSRARAKSPPRVSQSSSNVSPSPKRGRPKISTADQYDSETDTQRSSARERRITSDSRARTKSPPKKKIGHSSSQKKTNEERSRTPERLSHSRRQRESSSSDYEASRSGRHQSNEGRSGPSRTHEIPSTSSAGAKGRKQAAPRKNKAIQEIKRYQRETRLLLLKLPFSRVVKEICGERVPGLRWQVLAIEAIQEAAEIYLVHLFEDSLLCTLHRSRLTLSVQDMRLARRIRSRFEDY